MAQTTTAIKASTSQAARAALEQVLADRGIPGAGFGILQDGEVVISVAAGTANIVTGHPVTEDTIWQAGSIGKTYTAVLVMQLVEDGLLDLDQPVVGYLPELRFADAAATQVITARHLLTHTSGIDGDKYDETGDLYGRGDDSLERYVADLKDLPQIVEPGRIWSYCNAGYIVLGRLIQVLRGQPYEMVLRERVIDAAGLNDTKLFAGEILQRNIAAGHLPGPDGELVLSPIWELGRSVNPAGGTPNLTIGDLLGFAQIFLNGGVAANGTRILSSESVAEMMKAHVVCPERELSGGHWGFGLMVQLEPGNPRFGHDGNTFGHTSAVRFVPEANLAYALISNRSYANQALADMEEAVINEVAGTVTLKQQKPVEGLAVDGERLAGVYSRFGVESKVAVIDDKPTMSLNITRESEQGVDPTPMELRPVDANTFMVFFPEAGDDLQVRFMEPDAQGRPQYMHFGGRIARRTV